VKLLINLLMATLLTLSLNSCSNAAENSVITTTHPKGAQQVMKTYYIGRFAIDVPAEFKLAVQSQKIRYAEITDFKWQSSGSHEQERNKVWAEKLSGIKKLEKPVDKAQIIIKEKNLEGIGKLAKIVEYYGNYLVTEIICHTVLVDYGEVGVFLTIDGEDTDMSMANLTNILRHYRLGPDALQKDAFYLNHGQILLPYLEQEESYARFEGPMGMMLKVEMEETHKVEEAGLLDRLAASLAINFAPGVDVDKIRTRKRTIAGLAGQEIVVRLSDKNSKELFFGWDYQGKENSGEHPEIKIGVEECPDGDLGEKLELWDKVLNSFRAAF